ncbi:MAG: hypothetical protein ABI895_04775 [Deltaproteobacteria bacterium]
MHALRPESASLWALGTNSGPPHVEQGLAGEGLAGEGVEQGFTLTARHTPPPSLLVDSEMVVAW